MGKESKGVLARISPKMRKHTKYFVYFCIFREIRAGGSLVPPVVKLFLRFLFFSAFFLFLQVHFFMKNANVKMIDDLTEDFFFFV